MEYTYTLKIEKINNSFISDLIKHPTTSLELLGDSLHEQIRSFPTKYTHVEIPIKIEILLRELLKIYLLERHLSMFITLVCASQETYNLQKNFLDKSGEAMIKEIMNSKKDLKKLFDIIEPFITGKPLNNLISFEIKFADNKGQKPIKNSFVIKEIIQSIIEHYELTPENFFQQKKQILEKKDIINYNKSYL